MRGRGRARSLLLVLALVLLAVPAVAGPGAAAGEPSDRQQAPARELARRTIQRLRSTADGQVSDTFRQSTGVAGFVRVSPGGDLLPASVSRPTVKAAEFFSRYGDAVGVADARQLRLTGRVTDAAGGTHLIYDQVFRGVPVFGAQIRAHLDAEGRLTAVNGASVPRLRLSTTPRLTAARAARLAIREVVSDPPEAPDGRTVRVRAADLRASARLVIYRTGLIRDVAGTNQLAYRVEVTDGAGIRDFVFVHAHVGKVLNRYSTVEDALFRRLFEQNTSTQVWQEGDPFPGSLNQDQQNIVNFSGDSYSFFSNGWGRDSYDGAGHEMQSVNNDPTIQCPNANWNGITTNYCNGVTADDVVAHEWGHAYTEFTHGLIYQWQPGALNESYSDIWGETIDMLNGAGTDSPAPERSDGGCSDHTNPVPYVIINSPASIAGECPAGAAAFGPQLTTTGVTGDVVLGDDGTGVATDACEPLANAADVAGNIALVDRGNCAFTVKVKNAQSAGAVAAIVADNVPGPALPMGGEDATITIPSVRIALVHGDLLKSELPGDVNVTLKIQDPPREDTFRWLMGEDATAFGAAIRDMWNPRCLADPGKVSDVEYFCYPDDGGGVHTNSGVPNHGYALLVDGGVFNGQTVGAIGLTKAAHLYFQAMTAYQTPTSDFVDHADALQASCADLTGVDLQELGTSPGGTGPSGETIAAGDCAQVDAMIQAVELRLDPTEQCDFQPILQPGEPPLCEDPETIYLEDFEDGMGGWTLTNQGVFSGWPELDWEQATTLPGGRAGSAAFGADPDIGNCDGGPGDVSGVMRMESPEIQIPNTSLANARLSFDHYIATESSWDGGNVKLSINGGPYSLIPASAFTFNPYNMTLSTAAAGNTNPLAGQPAFSGTDGGEVFSTWGQSQVSLAALGVSPGDTIRLRFDMGMDGCTGIDGWYVDDITVVVCDVTQPDIEIVPGGSAANQRTATLNLHVTGDEPLALSGSSSDQGVVPNGGISFGGSGEDRTVTIQAGASGTAVVTLTVTDADLFADSVRLTVFVGTNGANVLTGTEGPDLLFGLTGVDAIDGSGGIDFLVGGRGGDTLEGGGDADTLLGGQGDDVLSGGDGDDDLRGEQGSDTLTGGDGADLFSGGPGPDVATDLDPGEGDTDDGSIP